MTLDEIEDGWHDVTVRGYVVRLTGRVYISITSGLGFGLTEDELARAEFVKVEGERLVVDDHGADQRHQAGDDHRSSAHA